MAKKPKTNNTPKIAGNKKAFHDFFIEERIEAGMSLLGWEVKSIRAGKMQLKESYVLLKDGEAYLFGCHIAPLLSASTHIHADTLRTRKLLLHRAEINRLIGLIDRKGYTIVPLNVYWKAGRAKLEIGVAKGKKDHDKRETIKQREWDREKGRILKNRYD